MSFVSRLSRIRVHGLVGLEPPIFVHDGIDTISASQLNVDLRGRGYFASAEPLLYGIAESFITLRRRRSACASSSIRPRPGLQC
jgi:hypothetical protein